MIVFSSFCFVFYFCIDFVVCVVVLFCFLFGVCVVVVVVVVVVGYMFAVTLCVCVRFVVCACLQLHCVEGQCCWVNCLHALRLHQQHQFVPEYRWPSRHLAYHHIFYVALLVHILRAFSSSVLAVCSCLPISVDPKNVSILWSVYLLVVSFSVILDFCASHCCTDSASLLWTGFLSHLVLLVSVVFEMGTCCRMLMFSVFTECDLSHWCVEWSMPFLFDNSCALYMPMCAFHRCQPLLGLNLSPAFVNLYFPYAGWGLWFFRC